MHCEFCGSDDVVKFPLNDMEFKTGRPRLPSDPDFYVCRKCGKVSTA